MTEQHTPSSLTGFPPVVDERTEILILGSFPGVASLNAQQYYAHPRNQFWALISGVIHTDLVALPYSERLPILLAHKIGLWDVIEHCERPGSLDSAIRHATPNQFDFLREFTPGLRRICFNGKTAAKAAPTFIQAGFETLVLPSSSPANAQLTYQQKLLHWEKIR